MNDKIDYESTDMRAFYALYNKGWVDLLNGVDMNPNYVQKRVEQIVIENLDSVKRFVQQIENSNLKES